MFIKTVSTTSGINPIKFDETGGVFYWILNTGSSTIYASTKATFTAGDDGVVSLGPKESRRLETNNDTIYILGEGQVEIHNQRDGICSFKQAPTSSGGGGTIDAYTKTESDAKYAQKTDIPDSYTKNESDTKYAQKTDVPDAYTKTESDAKYAAKTDVPDAYTKTESDAKYASKASYGDTTINVGRKAGSAVGENSTAEGFGATASGYWSHAEGSNATASGVASHAEGGYIEATGNYSHAEGYQTYARGHVSHAEGSGSTADGDYSHAGGFFAKTTNDKEFACGTFNQSNEDTLFSVGDGTDSGNRHNAFEITKTGGKLHDRDIAVKDDIIYPNLLINPDFKINQRGLSSYNVEWHYTVDRWVQFGSVVSPNSSGSISISKRDEAGYFGFIQRTEILQSDCIDKSMTLSAKIDGEVLSGTIIRNNAEQEFFNAGNSSDRFVISSYTNNGNEYILIQFYGSKTYNIEWVKMEYGSIATPFIPPDPATELMKCRRYYRTMCRGTLAVAVDATSVAFVDSFDVPMRIDPTAKILSPVVLNYSNGWLDQPDVTKMSIVSANLTKMGVCYVHVSGFNVTAGGTAFTANFLFKAATDNFIEFDAEIY